MPDDEKEIRELVSTWHGATRAGDVDTVLGLIADDAVFLVAGRDPMDKAEFARLSRAPADQPRPQFEGTSDIQEITISGDWAFMWTRLVVVVRPAGSAPIERRGHTLTVLHRVNGKWLLARDANLLAPVQRPAP